MNPKLANLVVFLTKLDMDADKIPTLAEYRKKYRDKMHLYPDKAGKESEEVFKEITEAANKVHAWITENPELQPRKTDETLRVVKCFDRKNNVEYNANNVVIHVDEELCEGWVEALSKRFGLSIPLEDQVGVQFKTSHLNIPQSRDTHGSFSALVWQKPKNGQPKILLQGKAYMTFVSFVVPEILKEIEAKIDKTKVLEDSVELPKIPLVDGEKKEERTNINKDVSIPESDFQTMMLGFQKMESEVIKLRDNLVGIVDESVNTIKDNMDMKKFEQKIDKLEKIVLDNKSELNILNDKIDQVISHQQKEKPVDGDALEHFIASSQTIFTKLENITSIHMGSGDVLETVKKIQLDDKLMQDFMADSKNICAKLDEVNKVTIDIKDDLAKMDHKSASKELKTIVENSEKLLPVLSTINKKVSSLVEHMEAPLPPEQPSVRPKEKIGNKDASTNKEGQTDKVDEIEIRKGIFFSSSIGLQCDLRDLQNNLNSEIHTVKTFHIEKHTNAKDPEMFLRKNLDILDESGHIDYIILSVGTNDITKLDLGEDIGDLIDTACEHSKNLVHLANQTAQKYNIDVFIVERPARFDKEDRDPEGKRSILTISANGLFHSLITPLKRVHYIPLPSLSPGRAKKDCFVKDGVHLSSKGEQLFCHDIEVGVKAVFSDIKKETTYPRQDGFQKAGKKPSSSWMSPTSKDQQGFQPLGDDRNQR